MEVEMIDSDNGILSPKPPGIDQGDFGLGADTDDLLMTRFMGRWIPKDLADAWPSMKEMMENDLEQALDAQQNSEDMQGAVMMAGMMTGLVGGVLDQLLAASSQAEFDQILTQSAAMLGGGVRRRWTRGPGLGGLGRSRWTRFLAQKLKADHFGLAAVYSLLYLPANVLTTFAGFSCSC